MKILVKILSPLLVLMMLPAQAATDLSIYRAYGSVKNQSDTERNIAASLYLGEVIVRVSGRRDAMLNPVIQRSIPKASSYLFSFSYTGNKTEIIEGKPQVRLGIQLDFSPQAINQLLREAQLPLWPSPRPQVLLWPVFQDGNGLQRVLDEQALHELERQAFLRGISIKLPDLDLEDNLALPLDDLWHVDMDRIRAASARYKTDFVALVRFQPQFMGDLPLPKLEQDLLMESSETSEEFSSSSAASSPIALDSISTDASSSEAIVQGPWIIEWQLLDQTDFFKQERVDTLAPAFGNFAHELADKLSTRFAIALGQVSITSCYLHIGSVKDFSAMKQSQAYLQSLALVQKAELLKVNQDGLLTRLTIEGDARLLESTLSLGRKLRPEFTPVVEQASSSIAATSDQNVGEQSFGDQNLVAEEQAASSITPEVVVPVCTADQPLRYLWQE